MSEGKLDFSKAERTTRKKKQKKTISIRRTSIEPVELQTLKNQEIRTTEKARRPKTNGLSFYLT